MADETNTVGNQAPQEQKPEELKAETSESVAQKPAVPVLAVPPAAPVTTSAPEAQKIATEAPVVPPETPGKEEPEKTLAEAILTIAPDKMKGKITPAILASGTDFLHGGNAVSAAQEKSTAISSAPPSPASAPETEFERNLREAGLKEALEHANAAPERTAVEKTSAPEGGVPRLRTYAADMSEEIRKRGAALSTIIAAEQTSPRRETVVAPQEPAKKMHAGWWAVGALVLVVLGIGVALGAFLTAGNAPATTTLPPSIIPLNERGVVALATGVSLPEALAGVRASANLSLGEMEGLDVTQNGTALSAYEILTALGAPNELARNATGILVGIHLTDHVQPFLLVSVSAYENAFSGMLAWEPTMAESLGNFFAPNGVSATAVAAHPPALSFTDQVFQNLNIRASDSNWPIVYTFPRRDLLLITTNEATVREIISRLSLQSAGQ